jgi:glycosyltransferase involved in cell wall biosynthesis
MSPAGHENVTRRAQPDGPVFPLFSVIVPTRDEARLVPQFLAAVPSVASIELIVVDSSRDETADLFERSGRAVTVIRRRLGVAAARHAGAVAARGQWLIFTDVDVVFEMGYFGRLELHEDADVVYGVKRPTAEFRVYGRMFARAQSWLHAAGVPAASGSNLAVRQDAYLESGGFRSDLPCSEDTELGIRLKRLGKNVRFDPRLRVHSLDDRRLRRGLAIKNAHALARGALILLEPRLPRVSRTLRSDWGYWKAPSNG